MPNAHTKVHVEPAELDAHARRVAQQIIDSYDEIDFDAHAVAKELVERHGFTDLDEGLRALPPGQFAYWSLVTKHTFR